MSGIQALQDATGDKGYDDLDDSLRLHLTHKEWLWFSDAEKVRLLQSETEPEAFEDGS